MVNKGILYICIHIYINVFMFIYIYCICLQNSENSGLSKVLRVLWPVLPGKVQIVGHHHHFGSVTPHGGWRVGFPKWWTHGNSFNLFSIVWDSFDFNTLIYWFKSWEKNKIEQFFEMVWYLKLYPSGPYRNFDLCSLHGSLEATAVWAWSRSCVQQSENKLIPTWCHMSCGRNYVHGELAMSKLGGPLSVVKLLNFLSFHYLK